MSVIQFYGLIKKPIDYDSVKTKFQTSELRNIIFDFELTEDLDLDDIQDLCETSGFKDWEWIYFILELAETGDYALLRFFCRGLSEREVLGLPDSEIGLERLVPEAQLLKVLELLRAKFPAIEILKIDEGCPPTLKFLVSAEELLKKGTPIPEKFEKEQTRKAPHRINRKAFDLVVDHRMFRYLFAMWTSPRLFDRRPFENSIRACKTLITASSAINAIIEHAPHALDSWVITRLTLLLFHPDAWVRQKVIEAFQYLLGHAPEHLTPRTFDKLLLILFDQSCRGAWDALQILHRVLQNRPPLLTPTMLAIARTALLQRIGRLGINGRFIYYLLNAEMPLFLKVLDDY